jgi:hypothetical protein
MRVIGCCTYPTSIPYRRRIEHDAHDFIQAVKGRPMNGYTGVPVRGVRRVIINTHLDRALEILAVLTCDIAVPPLPLYSPILVPIPNASNTLTSGPPRTYTQAQFIARQLAAGAEAIDLFRWREARPSVNSSGGTRDPGELYEALVVRPEARSQLQARRPYVLIDDVLTSGGHLQAVDAALENLVGRRAAIALVAGVSDDKHVEDPFAVQIREIEDFVPRQRRDDWWESEQGSGIRDRGSGISDEG